jgi:hypothetical protein
MMMIGLKKSMVMPEIAKESKILLSRFVPVRTKKGNDFKDLCLTTELPISASSRRIIFHARM